MDEHLLMLDNNSTLYYFIRTRIIDIEKIILKQLGFELYRILDTPHCFFTSFIKLLKIPLSSPVIKRAWSFINDSFMTKICLFYPP